LKKVASRRKISLFSKPRSSPGKRHASVEEQRLADAVPPPSYNRMAYRPSYVPSQFS
jgi:hypothetical protein